MKFRRKSDESALEQTDSPAVPEPVGTGPWDVDEVDLDHLDGRERIDLGSLLLAAVEGLDVQLQVDEATEEVQSVLLAGPEAAVELRAFAAPRHGDLWSEVRPRIAAEYAQRGGTASEREGRYGTELVCQLTVRTDDGRTATQPSRVVGINGPRWMLRATFLGKAALEPDAVGPWDTAVEAAVVRRGAQAMPVGAELPITLPPRDRLQRREG